MDRLYRDERASRERMWKYLVDLTEEDRRNPRDSDEPELVADIGREPSTIVNIERNRKGRPFSGPSDPLAHSEQMFLTYPTRNGYRCYFCSTDIEEHQWSSFERQENGQSLPRWQPSQCTFYKLFDRIVQDFFPGQQLIWNVKSSHLANDIRLDFDGVHQGSNQNSGGRIKLDGEIPWSEYLDIKDVPAKTIDQQFDSLKKWISGCDTTDTNNPEADPHTCIKRIKLGMPSKRMLDLTKAHTGLVRVIETGGRHERYLALSHCWGDPGRHPPKTTRANLKNHASGISTSDLPRTFCDAITVCDRLGVRYLWIDCLCIVQDDNDEWLGEAEKMAEIYQNSYLTIVAAGARDSHDGFLTDLVATTAHYEIQIDRSWDKDASRHDRIFGSFRMDKDLKFSRGSVNTRGWCLQEWYLPLRLIEFGRNDFRFVCLREVQTRFGRSVDEHTKTRTIVRGFGIDDEPFFRNLWESIREDFFLRDLTYPSDMLPALAGLAKLLETVLHGVPGHRYLAGLWSTRLSEDLSWGVHEFEGKTKVIGGVPTWSWASITTAVGYIYGRPSRTFVELVEARCTGMARPIEKPAALKIRGHAAHMYLRVDHRQQDYSKRPHTSFWINASSAQSTKTEDVMQSEKAIGTRHYFVMDMPVCPTPHDHRDINVSSETGIGRVKGVIRASENLGRCRLCTAAGYVAPVKLLLLTQTDTAVTVLVLSQFGSVPASTGSSSGAQTISGVSTVGEPAYQRIGLLELDCTKGYPSLQPADGMKLAVPVFWRAAVPSARQTIMLI